MPIRPHRSALGEARAVVAALSPFARGQRGGEESLVLYDYVHKDGNSGLSLPQPFRSITPTSQLSGAGNAYIPTGTLYTSPFFISREASYQFGIEVKFSGPASFAMSIYGVSPVEDLDLYPKDRVFDLGVTGNIANNVRFWLPSSVLLAPGLYWMAYLPAANTFASVAGLNRVNGVAHEPALLGGNNRTFQIARLFSAGLPAVFPVGAALNASDNVPIVFMRAV